MSLPGQKVSRGELPIVLEGMKLLDQSRYDTQLWMCLVMKVKPNAAKKSIVQESEIVHESRETGHGQAVMVRINTNIVGISELKWTGMGEFNSDDHIYYCGQESHRRKSSPLSQRKSLKCSTWVQPQK